MLIRHTGDLNWHSPAERNFASEDDLQQMLKESPDLLPGTDGRPLLIARELQVPDTGPVDIVAIGLDGTIRLIECKLRRNPEIRRHVVGQLMAYASGLWGASLQALDRAFRDRTGEALLAAGQRLAAEASEEFEPEAFTSAVQSSLRDGAFQLVIAVDEITDELKRTVTFLNQKTSETIFVLALELSYVKDGSVEILEPVTYGEESGTQKQVAPRSRWTRDGFTSQLESSVAPDVSRRLRRIFDHADTHQSPTSFYWGTGRRFWWGHGKYGSASAWFEINGQGANVWTIYLDPINTVFAFNFGWLRKAATTEQLRDLAASMRQFDVVAPLYRQLEEKGWLQRPSIPAAQLFSDDSAVDYVLAAIDRLIDAG